MRLELSEVLACPSCGPPQVMVAVVHASVGHRVTSGFLACPACNARFPVVEGVVQLAGEAVPSRQTGVEEPLPADSAVVLGAVLNLASGSGRALLGPGLTPIADEVASLAPGWEVVSLAISQLPAGESRNLSRVVVSGDEPPPVLKGRFGAVGLAGDVRVERAREFAAALGPLGRLAVVAPGADAAKAMKEAGLELLAADDRVAVASRRT